MARIRSIHPQIWTDEDFVALRLEARLFLIGLWGQADDYGLFDWKPVGLKMRLAPNDNIDAAAILESLVQSGFLVRIERGARSIGVVRSFRRWQRPKNPSQPIVEMDDEIASIIALKLDNPTPALPQPYPSPTENPALMEDVGDKRVEERSDDASRATPASIALAKIEPACLAIVRDTGWPVETAQDWHALTRLAVDEGLDVETEILPAIRQQSDRARQSGKRIGTWGYFASGCREFARQARSPPQPMPSSISHFPQSRNGNRHDPRANTIENALARLKNIAGGGDASDFADGRPMRTINATAEPG